VAQVSIVIPVRNGAATLGEQLEALARMDDVPCDVEVVVADNGSTDGTAALAQGFAGRLPVRVVSCGHASGINVARNCGIRATSSDRVLLCDADDQVDAGWLAAMHRAFEAGGEVLGGPLDYRRLNSPTVRAWRGAEEARVGVLHGFLPSAHGANLGFTRAAFEAIDGFDETFRGGGDDTDFVWRAQLAGHRLSEVPDAVVHYRLRPTLRSHVRQWYAYGRSEALLHQKFASSGMTRRSGPALLRDLWWLASRLPLSVPLARRGAWLRRAAQLAGRLVVSVRHKALWW
jgi:glycosyltransferase involved in cell wall biosynthesis